MAISTRSYDKFAFLFAGSSDSQYLSDLAKVLDTLLNWYGYPSDQVYVRVPFDITNLTDPVFSATGLDLDNITGTDSAALKSSLQTSMEEFIDMAKGLLPGMPAGELNNTFFYFTGNGRINPNNNRYELHIGKADDNTDTYIDGLWLKGRIYSYDLTFKESSHIHILMQQSFGYGFWQDVFSLIADPDLRLTFTAACNSGAVNPPNVAGSDFTDYWTKALRFEQREEPAGSGNFIFADQEDTGGVEPDDNLLISLYKAYLFANSFTRTSTEPTYEYKLPSGEPVDQYLGLPSFWIRDGDEPIPPEQMDYWWESKDIFLTHPDNADPDEPDDRYHAGTANNIHVIIRNNGTHPVREFYSGTIIFLTGGGGVGDSVVHIVNQILKPGEAYEHIYQYDFTGSEAHRCIKSRASLYGIDVEELDMDGINDVAWAVTDRSNEAQRNIDKYTISGKSATGTGADIPEPGKGMADETNPEEEAKPPVDENGNEVQPEGTTESRSTSNLRNFAEHRIILRNIFKKEEKFIISDPIYDPYIRRYSRIQFFSAGKDGKTAVLKKIERPFGHYAIDLKPGETRELIVYIAPGKGKKILKPLNIGIEIYLYSPSLRDAVLKRMKGRFDKDDITEYFRFSGFTMDIVHSEGTTLCGTVFDSARKPVKNAFVYIMSGDKRQSAIMKTNRFGSYCVKDINPDNYIIMVKTGKKEWPAKTVFAGEGMVVRTDFFEKPVRLKNRNLK